MSEPDAHVDAHDALKADGGDQGFEPGRGSIVCTQHGGCSPGACFDLHHPPGEAASEPDGRCAHCRAGDHEQCDTPDNAGRMDRCCDGITTRGLTDRADPDA